MRQLFKYFLCIGCLVFNFQSAWAFSLLGPSATYTTVPQGDLWQVIAIGYNPIPSSVYPPYLADALAVGPKNLGEGYRRNAPVMYYTFDSSFSDWFGASGETAVQQAFGILNDLTNVDSYSSSLVEFPLNSETENYTASAVGLLDVKSTTLSLLLEQLGLTDSVRYTWTLHDRTTIPGCVGSCPLCLEYVVIMRNYDYYLTPLGYVSPDWGQYSPYVNGELFGYQILEDCIGSPLADAFEVPVNNTVDNPPVASGLGEGSLADGIFYSGLTRDDVAGLRWLYSTNNYDTPSTQYRESPAAGSTLFSTNFSPGAQQLLSTTNYNALFTASLTNSPANLQALFPALTFSLVTNYFSNVVSMNVLFVTNTPIGGVSGQQYNALQTNFTTNIVEFFQYTFDNVVTNKTYVNTTYALQTITVGPPIGSVVGSPFVTNVTYQAFQSNIVSGDYFVITNGTCGPNIIQTLQTNVNLVTNTIVTGTSANGGVFTQNLISYFTNYVFVVQPCTLLTNAVADYQGIGRMQFVQVADFDYQNGVLTTPITNQYTMVVITNGQAVTETFQRVVTTPDFVFTAQDLENGPAAAIHGSAVSRNINLNQANESTGLAGPGTIDSPTTITYNKVGPDYVNQSPFMLFGPNGASSQWFIWGSFDGTTNTPVVYPNGTSIANLAASALIHVSPAPPNLQSGTNGVAYNVTLSATGGQPTYTWMLTTNSAGLPPGLSLSSGGVISGTPTQSGTFVNILVQMTDSSFPIPISIIMDYTITIN